MMFPAQRNSRALNRAWVKRWNSARFRRPRPMAVIMTPSWLNVDRAITFFKSDSKMALMPAINIVIEAMHRITGQNAGVLLKKG